MKLKYCLYLFIILSGFILGFSINNFRTSNPKLDDYLLVIFSTILTVTTYLSLHLLEDEESLP